MTQRLIVAYRDVGFGMARPYLVLRVSGVDGRGGLIPGLIDSGADRTVLPAGYASLMGYGPQDLESVQGLQVGGSVILRNAKTPSRAFVPEIPHVVFEITPSFVDGCQTALWGRADVMRRFDVTIVERHQRFILSWDD
jgi:hypothetical protein